MSEAPEAPLKAPDEPEQAGQEAPFRLGSLGEETPAVDVVVNGRLVARGDVVVVEDSFGVRVTEIVEP